MTVIDFLLKTRATNLFKSVELKDYENAMLLEDRRLVVGHWKSLHKIDDNEQMFVINIETINALTELAYIKLWKMFKENIGCKIYAILNSSKKKNIRIYVEKQIEIEE